MATLMMQKAYPGDATVTVCHSRSKDLVKECQEADIIIAALGQPNFVKAEMVKEGAVVIDVGTTRVPDASKKSGFKFLGSVTVYAFMQSVGLVNDHARFCFRYKELREMSFPVT